MANRWKRFDQEAEECFVQADQGGGPLTTWTKTFETFQKTLAEERKQAGGKKISLEDLEDQTEWEHEFSGWIEEYLAELEEREEYALLQASAEWLKEAFDWVHGDFLELGAILERCREQLGGSV